MLVDRRYLPEAWMIFCLVFFTGMGWVCIVMQARIAATAVAEASTVGTWIEIPAPEDYVALYTCWERLDEARREVVGVVCLPVGD